VQPLPLPWTFAPSIVLGLLGAAGFYVARTRRDGVSTNRALLFWTGLACFAVALVTPLDAASDHYLLSAHMAQHLLLTMIGPPLLLAGLPEDFARRLPRFIVNPWLGVFFFNAILLAWHVPAFYQATLYDDNLHVLEHVLFIASALIFWWPIVGPATARRPMSPLMKVGYLGLAAVPPTVIGVVMAFVPVQLYAFYAAAPRLFPSISPSLDQQLAGLQMFGLGNFIYFAVASWAFFQIGNDDGSPERLAAGS
jgi:cytochrome c oxidase assembly factor CtaG